jgi:hypothetical protein
MQLFLTSSTTDFDSLPGEATVWPALHTPELASATAAKIATGVISLIVFILVS